MSDASVFHMKVLGRMIEHLGSQMYKHRAPSIAELVANCWDAGAKNVWLEVPEDKGDSPNTAHISVRDDGDGMTPEEVDDKYMIVGRNRREEGSTTSLNRKVMGRKGIGKLAGFGLANTLQINTWTTNKSEAIHFKMSLSDLRGNLKEAKDIDFPWKWIPVRDYWSKSGTEIELCDLRHSTPIDISGLREALSRRFSRATRGAMKIHVNNVPLADPEIEVRHKFPESGEYHEEVLSSGKKIKYRYSFASKPIPSKELQGFVIYANERTAQAPPFFFNVESTASGQHSTRYVFGEIIADYLDEGSDADSDVISTDRQEIDWEKDELKELYEWGQKLSRRVLIECADSKGEELKNWIFEDKEFESRTSSLHPNSKKEIESFLKVLGQKTSENDTRTRQLASSLIRAYEFQTFHDVVSDIEAVKEDPDKLEELLGRIHDWKVLESRAILEIVKGRLGIVHKLQRMILENAPETASSKTYDNLHDLLAEYPWLFHPEWQVFEEEKSIGKYLEEWGNRDASEDMKAKRIDFLAFSKDSDEVVIIEIKRPGHAVEYGEISRLLGYQHEVQKTCKGKCTAVLIHGGAVNVQRKIWEQYLEMDSFKAMTWSEMFSRASSFYRHYEAVLDGDQSSPGFKVKETEVARTRKILETGISHRSSEDRRRGLGDSNQ